MSDNKLRSECRAPFEEEAGVSEGGEPVKGGMHFNQCYGSGMCLSPIRIFPIPDIESSNKKKEEERGKICCFTGTVATNFTKFKIILFLNRYRKKN